MTKLSSSVLCSDGQDLETHMQVNTYNTRRQCTKWLAISPTFSKNSSTNLDSTDFYLTTLMCKVIHVCITTIETGVGQKLTRVRCYAFSPANCPTLRETVPHFTHLYFFVPNFYPFFFSKKWKTTIRNFA